MRDALPVRSWVSPASRRAARAAASRSPDTTRTQLGRCTTQQAQTPPPRGRTSLPAVVGGRYRPIRQLAVGGAGVVYEAEHLFTGARVALKLMTGSVETDAELAARFYEEARILNELASVHIVRVLDAGIAGDLSGRPFLVMELLSGCTLEEEARTPMAAADVVDLLTQVADAMEYVHARGIVHCDLKPENIFVVRDDSGRRLVKVLDFGIAKRAVSESVADDSEAPQVLGTLSYMSPEQARGERAKLDARTDTWALGMIAYRLLSGRPYFHRTSVHSMVLRLGCRAVVSPSATASTLSAAFDSWFLRSCSSDIELRFASPRAQIQMLARALDERPKRSQPAGDARLPRRPCRLVHAGTDGSDASLARPHDRRSTRSAQATPAPLARASRFGGHEVERGASSLDRCCG